MAHTQPSRLSNKGPRTSAGVASLLCALSLGACGGGSAGSSVTPAPAPVPDAVPASAPAPTAQGLAGVWSDNLSDSVLMVTAGGLAIGQLNSNAGAEVLRGTLLGRNGELQTRSFDAASLEDASAARQLALGGNYQANSYIAPNLVAIDGTPITLIYDPGHTQAIPLADQAGTYNATVFSEGYGGEYTLTLQTQGQVSLTSVSRPNCTVQGTLSLLASTPGLTDLKLRFTGTPCMVPSGMTVRGLAIFDPALRRLSAVATNNSADIGLYFTAVP